MRFEAIELQRYGRFTDERLRFARQSGDLLSGRQSDFHLVLGANEAGKSTLRQAFHDVLFGIPMNTPMGFLHAGTDLALGAVLSGEHGELAFGRRRKRNGGLVDAAGEPLAAEALRPWLSGVNAAFFERMFGLDHERLERGSRSMLQAGDDVDSVLFQAAAGVAALSEVLEALRSEAAELWAPRASRTRAWYAAAGQYDEAAARVRNASVRTSAWVDADRERQRLEKVFAQAQSRHSELVARMRELERLGRLAPLLAQVRQYESRLHALEADVQARSALVAYQAEILRLDHMRPRLADYRSEIEQCRSRIGLLQTQLGRLLRQLGRDVITDDEAMLDGIMAQLPTRPLRREIEQLLHEARQLSADCDAAERALNERRKEQQALRADIESLPKASASAALREAVEAAAEAGDIATQVSAAGAALEREEASLQRCLSVLRQAAAPLPIEPQAAVDTLAAMQAWSSASLNAQVHRRQQLQAEVDNAEARCREAGLEVQAAELALDQFRRQHQAVSRDEVMAARRERDALWASLHEGRASIADQGEQFTTLLRHADLLADKQLEAVGNAARLLSLMHDLERRESAQDGLAAMLNTVRATLAEFDSDWKDACAQRKLPALSPEDMQSWQADREAVLAAHERVQAAASEHNALRLRHDQLLAAVNAALAADRGAQAAAQAASGTSFTTLSAACRAARGILQQAQTVAARRQALEAQLARNDSTLPGLEQEFERRRAGLEECLQRKRAALARAALPVDADDVWLEDAMALLADADHLAGKLRDCRVEQERMQSDIAHFERDALNLAATLGLAETEARQVETLVASWAVELEQHRQAVRARDEARQRLTELGDKLLEEGGGHSREQIEAEVDAADLADLSAQHEMLAAELEQAAEERSRLAVELEQTRKALQAISGSDAAAQAEAERQAALADMAEIADRYVRLYTQHRLLERVIERYRERRQGPLLAKAGAIFRQLTLGSHIGLVVDDQAEALYARCADGRLVGLEGLSDGTRDQLYLSLRLAALELYLDTAAPMPFIADDLFVNYDDGRALAGLRKLADVAQHTQVIFLTHHAHMVELARQALDGRLNIIELGA